MYLHAVDVLGCHNGNINRVRLTSLAAFLGVFWVPNASEQGTKSEKAHEWADWLHNRYHLGVPNASKRGTKTEVAHKWADWLNASNFFVP